MWLFVLDVSCFSMLLGVIVLLAVLLWVLGGWFVDTIGLLRLMIAYVVFGYWWWFGVGNWCGC